MKYIVIIESKFSNTKNPIKGVRLHFVKNKIPKNKKRSHNPKSHNKELQIFFIPVNLLCLILVSVKILFSLVKD